MKNNNPEVNIDSAANFVFSTELLEKTSFVEKDLIRLKVYGLSVNNDFARPFLLLKDEAHEYTLPVAVNPLEAGVALSQANKAVAPTTPHRFTEALMESMHMQVEKCIFVEIKGHYQYVRIYLKNHPTQKSLKLRADEVMSLCLHLDIPIYASKEYIDKSRVMSADLAEASADLKAHPGLLQKNHPYIM